MQLALRQIVGGAKIDELLEARERFGERLVELAAGPVSDLGLRLLGADIKDVMFPGELKKIFAQVVQARQEGLAALEKARGETAALRNLANAARLVDGNPALIQLRMLQAVAAQPGSTIVLGAPGVVPVSKPAPRPRGRRSKDENE
jgi:CelD/BcsL family acetyltransferase involved in cellulose biosynthesis